MRKNPFNSYLRSPADDQAGEGGGGSAPENTQTAPPPEQKPGVVEMAIAGLKSKAALNAEISTLKQQLETAKADLTTMTGERDSLAAKVKTYEAERDQLSAALATAESEKQTVDESAAAKLRSHGVDPKKLPAATEDEAETKEALEARLAKTEDPKERFRLTEKLMALEG